MPSKPQVFRPSHYLTYTETRPTARDRGYTKRWARVSRLFKDEHPICIGCQAVGRVAPTEVTDHIIPHKGDQALLWDQDNWQPACRPHHDVVKQKLELLFAQGKVTVADLRLDSAKSMELTRELLR